jgi:predicted ester cyclase
MPGVSECRKQAEVHPYKHGGQSDFQAESSEHSDRGPRFLSGYSTIAAISSSPDHEPLSEVDSAPRPVDRGIEASGGPDDSVPVNGNSDATRIDQHQDMRPTGPPLRRISMSQPKTDEEQRNERVIRKLYGLAEAATKDSPQFVSLFAEGGYFYDVSAGKKYYGTDIGYTVEVYASAFPDMHRELYSLYCSDDVVVVELSLNGTHKGNLPMPDGFIPPTGKEMHAPCCDVFHLKDGKVVSFHCYLAASVLLGQLGVIDNLGASIRR